MSWTAYLLGPFYTILPKRWRYIDHYGSARFMARCTMVSGVLESVAALLVLRYWYMSILTGISDIYAQHALGKEPGDWAHIAPETVGGAGFMLVLGNPITWIMLYFGAEGVLRLAAAAIAGESFGTLPLCAIDFLFAFATRNRGKKELPLVRDEILPGDSSSDLRIASCQKRLEWKYPFTIRYEGAFFQVVAMKSQMAGPRPHIYSLRRLPPGEPARGLRDYHPDDVLLPVARVRSLA